MRIYRSDDPVRDAERYARDLDALLEKRPKCHCCHGHIQDNEALHYRSSEFEFWMCKSCVNDNLEYIDDEEEEE